MSELEPSWRYFAQQLGDALAFYRAGDDLTAGVRYGRASRDAYDIRDPVDRERALALTDAVWGALCIVQEWKRRTAEETQWAAEKKRSDAALKRALRKIEKSHRTKPR